MKNSTQTRILQTILCLLLSANIFAQTRNIAITPPTNVGSCTPNNYEIQFSNCSGAHMKINPSLNITGTCGSITQGVYMMLDSVTPSGAVTLVRYGDFLKFVVNTNSPVTLNYSSQIDCHLVTSTISASLTQTFSDTTNTYNITVDNNGTSYITPNIKKPDIALINQGNLGASYLTNSYFDFYYKNNGIQSIADIRFTFIPDLTNYCGQIDTGSIVFQNGVNGSPILYTNSASIVLQSTDTLIIRQPVFIDSCIQNCPQVTASFSWWCNYDSTQAGAFCNSCGNPSPILFNYNVNNNDLGLVDVLRFSPDSSSYELGCMNDNTNSTLWSYAIINKGVGAIDSLTFDLRQATTLSTSDLAALSLIDTSSVRYSLSQSHQCTVSTDVILRSNWLCQNYIADALFNYQFRVNDFGKSDTIYLSFRTLRCSASNDTLLNIPKSYNRWQFDNFKSWTVCGTENNETGSGFYNNSVTISGQSAAGGGYDVDLKLDYFPTVNTLAVNNGVGDKKTFAIELNGLTSNGTYVKQLFGCTTPNNQCSTLNGWMRVTLFCDSNLKVNNVPNDIKLIQIHGIDTFFISPVYYNDSLGGACLPGNYYYYFNLADSGMLSVLDSGQFIFTLTACCNSDLSPSPYNATFHVIANPNGCFNLATNGNHVAPPNITNIDGYADWLTLTRRGNKIAVTCPGCLSPGVIAENYAMRRITLGLQDSDNDGRCDSATANININSNWYAQNKNNLRTNFSGYGDKIEDVMTGYFVDGDPTNGGYNYENLTDLNLRFNVLQLSRIIPHGLSEMNLVPDSIILYIDDTTNALGGCLECEPFQKDPNGFTTQLKFVATPATFNNNVIESNSTNNEFRFYFTSYKTGVNSFVGNLHDTNYVKYSNATFTGFTPYQYYRVRVVYNLCGNFLSTGTTLDDVLHESDILNRLFLTGQIKRTFSDLLQQMPNTVDTLHGLGLTVDSNEVPTYSLVDSNFINQYMFFCQAATGLHYFVSNNVVNDTRITNNAGCNKTILVKASSTIAGGKTTLDAFPFEYKPPVLLPDSVAVIVPNGYYIANAEVRNSRSFGSTSGYSNWVPFSITPPTGTTYVKFNTLPSLYCFPQSTTGQNSDSMFAGDQFNERSLQLTLSPLTCPDTITPLPNSSIMKFNVQPVCFSAGSCGSSGDITLTSPSGPSNYNLLGTDPTIIINSIQNSNAALNSDTVCFNNIVIQNQSTVNPIHSDANNVFIALPQASTYLSNWFFVNPNNQNVSANGNVLGITTNLAYNTSITIDLCAVVANCPNQVDTIVFPIHFGWNCDSFPSLPYSSDSVCGLGSDTLRFYRAQTTFSTDGKNVEPNEYVLCDTIKVSAAFSSGQLGFVYPDSVYLNNLHAGLQVVNAYMVGDTSYSIAHLNSTLTDSIWTASPDSISQVGYPEGGINNGQTIVFHFDLVASCQYAGDSILPDIQVFAHDFCDSSFSFTAGFTIGTFTWGDSSICNDCFTVTKTASTDSLAAVSDTVIYTITVCNYSDTTYTYSVADSLPPNFTPSPFTSQTLTLAPSQCDSILISGTFSQTANCPANMNVAIVTNQNTNTVQQDSVCVTVTAPCSTPATVQILNNRTSRSLPQPTLGYANTNFYIQGIFIVDSLFTIYRCTMYVAPGGQIIVQSSGGLTGNFIVNESVIQGCFQMWRGINVLDGSILEVDGQYVERRSIIADADTAVYAFNGTRITILNSNVINNIIGIYLPIRAGGLNSIQLTVERSKFGLYAAQLKPYFNATIIPSIPIAGIYLNDWNGFIGAYSSLHNDFYNMQNGIYGYRSTFISRSNYFERMRPDPNGDLAYNYGAVASLGQTSVRSGSVTVEAVAGGTPTMYNCSRGVYANKSDADVQYVFMDKMQSGIVVTQNNNMQTATLSYNTINAKLLGIQLTTNSGSNVTVEGNQIAIDTIGSGGLTPSGIYISEGSPSNPASYYIAYNNINGARDFRNGIFLQNVKEPVVVHNVIKYSSGKESSGINITNCKFGYFSCNQVTAHYPHTNANVTRGIYSRMGSDNDISCNGVDSTWYGFLFDDVQLQTHFNGNAMSRHFEGLRLTKIAVIDTQSLAGNQWYGPFTTGGYGAHNLNDSITPNLQASLFETDLSSGTIYTPSRPANNALWFLNKSGTSYDCGNNPFCIAAARQSESNEGLLEKIAKNYTITSDYQDEAKLRGKEYLYEKLESDPQLLASDVDFQNFKITNDNSAIGKLYDAKDNLSQITNYDSSYKSVVNLKYALIKLKQDSINAIDSLEKISPSANYFSLRDNLLAEITTYESNIANLKYQWDVIAATKINLAETKNNSVSATQIQHSNEKFVNTVTIDFERNGIFAIENNFLGLTFIAEQCPNVGGSAVFKARALLDLITDPRFYDDENSCAQYGYRKAQQNAALVKEVNKIIVYPNPSSGIISIEINGISNSLLNIQVQDNEGRVLKTLKINYKFEPIQIDVSDVPSGFYVLRVKTDTEIESREKLLIIK